MNRSLSYPHLGAGQRPKHYSRRQLLRPDKEKAPAETGAQG